MPTDDELALTATAPGARPSAKKLERTTLGRFKLERELGAGGMGVVHAAFDPELERRVAVKVLRASSEDSRARLLREARAMAKLSHGNVITVFDVGSADGEDFVAMELIDGGTLGEWVARDKPRPREIMAAYVAAGRGLAAAHAEGLVHRDFKPNNVLRSKSGRIVVTDFGLARAEGLEETAGSRAEPGFALDQTLAPTAPALTRTGSFLGTPAYMSPEQWRTKGVTPATDQFAFCVALWEALTGARPFGGTTLDELRAKVLEGPIDLDAKAIPRRLRPILRRGLAVDPASRWPSMTELLHAIERVKTRRYVVAASGLGLLAAGIAIYFATRSAQPQVVQSCVLPAIDPDAITLSPAAKPYVDQWRSVREVACESKREVRAARLACLDAVIARVVDVFRDRSPSPDALAIELVDPAVCSGEPPPRLSMPIDGRLSRAFATLREAKETWTSIDSELAADTEPACVRTVALLAALTRNKQEYTPTTAAKLAGVLTRLDAAAQACDDDAIKAQAALTVAEGEDPNTVHRAEAAAKQFPDDANVVRLDEVHADNAARNSSYDEALAGFERARVRHAAAGRKQSELEMVMRMARVHLARSNADDLDAVISLADRYKERARGLAREINLLTMAAQARWRQGHVEEGDRQARAAGYRYLAAPFVDSQFTPQDVKGIVVDDTGKPVPDAKVAAAGVLYGDDAEVSSPVAHISTPIEAITAADGTFTLAGARGTVMAAVGDRVSQPVRAAPSVKLVLGPTSTVEGVVDLGTTSFGRVRVVAAVSGEAMYFHTGPVDATGHFKLSRIPRGKIAIGAVGMDQVTGFDAKPTSVMGAMVTGIHLQFAPSGGKLYIVGRSETSTTPESALVMVFRGAHPDADGTFRAIFHKLKGPIGQVSLGHPDMATLAAPYKGHVEADDLIGELPSRMTGDLTLCVVGMSRKLLASATSIDKMVGLIQDADAGCVVVPAKTDLATVKVPAIKRLRPD